MPVRLGSVPKKRVVVHILAAAVGFTVALAFGGPPGGLSNDGAEWLASCRTVAAASPSCRIFASTTRSVKTFTGGQIVTDTTCTLDAATNEAVCRSTFNDSRSGPGTITQTSRFASRGDVVDEASVNPPRSLSLWTTTVTSTGGVSLTIKATYSYDAQRRLLSTTIDNPPPLGQFVMRFSAWDSAGRPTAGEMRMPQGTFPISVAYDAANRSTTRTIGPDTCTQTHDQNGNIIRESCTGRENSNTVVTVLATTQICK